jgi:cysteine desulfurase
MRGSTSTGTRRRRRSPPWSTRWRDAAREAWGNPSSVHAFGRAARGSVEDAREAVARWRCDPRDVVLTSGGTEANNLALRSAFAG